jgi:hypothetical protein
MRFTQHRYHAANNLERFTRLGDNPNDDRTYQYTACPGIDNSADQFPVIDTLLSIPFSLIHTLPRLTALVPPTIHQQQLITMGYEIMRLWWWDPPRDMIEGSRGIRPTRNNKKRNPRPQPIHLISATFSTTKPTITFGTFTAQSSSSDPHQVPRPIELPSGQILFGTMPSVSLDREGLLLTVPDEGSAEPMSVTRANKDFVTSSRVTRAWDSQSTALTEDSDVIDESTEASDVDGKSKNYSSSLEVISWYEKVVDCATEPLLPLTPTPFERGVIGGQSINDILMIKGLIDTQVYLHFFDLISFSLS